MSNILDKPYTAIKFAIDYPNQNYTIKNGEIEFWDSNNSMAQPTEAELTTWYNNLETEGYWANQEVGNARAKAYPSIQDQLDMMYHDQVDGTTTWKDAIAQVKADNPKSEV